MRQALFLGVLLCLSAAPGLAKTLIVNPAGGEDHTTISAALTAAEDGDRILVRRGTYAEGLTLVGNVTLEGEETAGTTIGGAVTFAEGATLQRFTLTGSVTLSSIATATLRNNIFADPTASALVINPATTDDGSVLVVNNTFYNNLKAIELVSASAAKIRHNIFVNNRTAISRTSATSGTITNNSFYKNDQVFSTGTPSADNLQGDPLFVGEYSSTRDLHITLNSASCGLGAFGDSDAEASPDSTPAPPAGVTATADGDGVRLTWSGNTACDSTVERYGIKFKTLTATNWSDFTEISADGLGSQHYTVSSSDTKLGDLPDAPTTPTGVEVAPLDSSLRVTWDEVTGADGYRITWGTAADSLAHAEDAGDTSTYVIDGLTNGTTYFAAVAAYENRKHHFAVTAFPETPSSDEVTGESQRSTSVQGATGKSASTASTSVSATPDRISGTPALESKSGCFVKSLENSTLEGSFLLFVAALGVGILCLHKKGVGAGALLLVAFLLAPSGARAEGPRWSVSAGGGAFYPAQENWTDGYDSNHLWEGKLGVGFRIIPQIEIGIDGGYRRAKGEVSTFDNGTVLDTPVEQTLTVIPLQAYLLLQLRLAENQWVVPYVAGGYSRYYYKHEVENGQTTKGHQDGYHIRGGLKILLDVLDTYFSDRAQQNWGILDSYLTLEAQYAKVDDRGKSETNLGGMSYSMGFVVEF